jgi:hypothetical protein
MENTLISIGITLPFSIFCAVNILKLPNKLTQQYPDGMPTEFRCLKENKADVAPRCFLGFGVKAEKNN